MLNKSTRFCVNISASKPGAILSEFDLNSVGDSWSLPGLHLANTMLALQPLSFWVLFGRAVSWKKNYKISSSVAVSSFTEH